MGCSGRRFLDHRGRVQLGRLLAATPSRVLPIAKESSAFPARYAAWSVGPMLQIDTVSIDPHEDGTGGTITLAMQNNAG